MVKNTIVEILSIVFADSKFTVFGITPRVKHSIWHHFNIFNSHSFNLFVFRSLSSEQFAHDFTFVFVSDKGNESFCEILEDHEPLELLSEVLNTHSGIWLQRDNDHLNTCWHVVEQGNELL
jgi:hypothetical protein